MPQKTWAQQTLTTVADVRNRLNSPEISFQYPKSDNVRIGYTVDTATDVFTTTVNHNFLVNDLLKFENTGGALPSPLTANTSYYVISVSPTTFKISTVKGGTSVDITTTGTGTNVVYNANLDILIQSKIDLSKDWIRQDLVNYFQQKIPTAIKSFLAFKRSQVDASQSEFSRNLELADRGFGSWSYPTYGFFSYDGLFIDISGYAVYGQIPLLRFNYGVPSNAGSGAGTFAGLAKNGDCLADMQNRNLYINRNTGTTDVTWDLFQAGDAINYILSPTETELLHMATSAAILAMAKDGLFRNRANYQDRTNVDYMDLTISFWRKEYERDKSRGLSLVDIDISGSGIMNDWKRGFTRSEVVILG